MANVIKNERLPAAFPGRFSKRENRASTHNYSCLEADSNYAILDDDGVNYIRSTGANTFTMPSAINNKGRCLRFYQVDAAAMTISANADGASVEAPTGTLDAAGDWAEYFCTGDAWVLVGQYVAV